MHELMVPQGLRTSGLADTALKAAVTDLGLKFSLVTQWTSFVAVSERRVNADPASARDSNVPLPMVKGVEPSAYPNAGRQPGLGGSRIVPTAPAGAPLVEARAPTCRRPSPPSAAARRPSPSISPAWPSSPSSCCGACDGSPVRRREAPPGFTRQDTGRRSPRPGVLELPLPAALGHPRARPRHDGPEATGGCVPP